MRKALNDVVRESSTLAQLYTGAANGQATQGNEMTNLVNVFTTALIECTKAGAKGVVLRP